MIAISHGCCLMCFRTIHYWDFNTYLYIWYPNPTQQRITSRIFNFFSIIYATELLLFEHDRWILILYLKIIFTKKNWMSLKVIVIVFSNMSCFVWKALWASDNTQPEISDRCLSLFVIDHVHRSDCLVCSCRLKYGEV